MGRSASSARIAARTLPRFIRRPPRPRPRPPRPGPNPAPKPGPQPPNAARSSPCLARLCMPSPERPIDDISYATCREWSALDVNAVEDLLRDVGRAGQLHADPHRVLPAGVAQPDLVDRDRTTARPRCDLTAQRAVVVRTAGARCAVRAMAAQPGRWQ